jgi:arabinofuranosyltransferase
MSLGSSMRSGDRSTADRASSIGGLAYASLLAGVLLYGNRNFYHDDAYITLRYARNLINGFGPVWNPGEQVQGYTNFLQLMLVSLLGRLGVDLVSASRIIGGAALIGLVAVLLVLGASASNDRRRPLWHVPMILVMTSAPLIVWSLGGLEGPLFSFLVAAGCLLFLKAGDSPDGSRAYAASGACLGLSFLARPDGIVFIAISAFWLLVMRRNKPGTLRNVVPFATAVALVTLPYLIWQVLYYGDLVPNTFYTKTGSLSWARLSSGFRYVADYATRPPFLPPLALGALVYAAVTTGWSAKLSYRSWVTSPS